MDDIIDRMRSEEAKLSRRLEAVRAFIVAYTDDAPKPRSAVADVLATRRGGPRQSDYASAVLDAAADVVNNSLDPVSTRDLVEALTERGVEIRGQEKGNALSALLSRSVRFRSNGRAGWTLAQEYGVFSPNENGAAEAAPDADGVAAPSTESRASEGMFD